MESVVSLDFRIGTSISRVVSEERKFLHRKTIEILGDTGDVEMRGHGMQLFMTWHDCLYNRARARDYIIEALKTYKANWIIVDFTPNDDQTDYPIIQYLADAFTFLREGGVGQAFVVLLKELPVEGDGPSDDIRKLVRESGLDPFRILLLDTHGNCRDIVSESLRDDEKTGFISEYEEIYKTLLLTPIRRLKDKTVRRLGHFPVGLSGDGAKLACRINSWLLIDAEVELSELLAAFWNLEDPKVDFILYDTRASSDFMKALCAQAMRLGISCERVASVVGNAEYEAKFRNRGVGLLAVDFVETGATASSILEQLNEIGISMSRDILAAVNKSGGADETRIGDLRIKGLSNLPANDRLKKDQCVQCDLGVPYGTDVEESLYQLRSYEMHFLVNKFGWEVEPSEETPIGRREGYPAVPNFDRILDEYGEWIAYKFLRILESPLVNLPSDYLLVCPWERDCRKILGLVEKLSEKYLPSIGVDRDAIKRAQNFRNEWGAVVSAECFSGAQWKKDLESVNIKTAVIFDIFNSSGGTSKSIMSLLDVYGIEIAAHVVVVDFDPNEINSTAPGMPRIALYEWSYPI